MEILDFDRGRMLIIIWNTFKLENTPRHALLHTNTYTKLFIENKLQIKNKYEIEADKFAAELLVDMEEEVYLYEGIIMNPP